MPREGEQGQDSPAAAPAEARRGPGRPPKPELPEIHFGEPFADGLLKGLSGAVSVMGAWIGGTTLEEAQSILGLTDPERKLLTPPAAAAIDRYATEWMRANPELTALIVIAGPMVIAKGVTFAKFAREKKRAENKKRAADVVPMRRVEDKKTDEPVPAAAAGDGKPN